MQYYIDIKENQEAGALIKYLQSLNIVNKVEQICEFDDVFSDEIKNEIRARYEFSKQNPETRIDWNVAKKKLYDRIQSISK